MFSFVKERKAAAALEAVRPGLGRFSATCTPVQRAAALAVANAMLIAGSAQWGREYSHSPMKLAPRVAADALCVLADHHGELEHAVSLLAGRPPGDPQVAAAKWGLLATGTVMMTAGCGYGREYAAAARSAWKSLWSARRAAREAARALHDHSRAYSVPPVPGRKTDLAHLERLASTLPPMFRKGN